MPDYIPVPFLYVYSNGLICVSSSSRVTCRLLYQGVQFVLIFHWWVRTIRSSASESHHRLNIAALNDFVLYSNHFLIKHQGFGKSSWRGFLLALTSIASSGLPSLKFILTAVFGHVLGACCKIYWSAYSNPLCRKKLFSREAEHSKYLNNFS